MLDFTQQQTISFRNWSQLNKNEKQTIINKIGDYEEKNSIIEYLSNVINNTIDENIVNDGDCIATDLETNYGIECDVLYGFFSQGSGFCFDAKRIDTFQLLEKLNYKNLFNNKETEYQQQLTNYLQSVYINTYRVNYHYDHENSVRFNIENHNMTSYELLHCNNDDESYPETNEFKLFQFFETEFNDDELVEFLNEWMHDFCIDSHKYLEKNFDLNDEDMEEILGQFLEYYKEYDKEKCVESDIIVFINADDKIIPISLKA